MYKSLNEFEIRPDATTGFHGNRKGYKFKKIRGMTDLLISLKKL